VKGKKKEKNVLAMKIYDRIWAAKKKRDGLGRVREGKKKKKKKKYGPAAKTQLSYPQIQKGEKKRRGTEPRSPYLTKKE